jgi:hypothetical protein
MRRSDTQGIGEQAETLAADLLRQRGFAVRNLNEERFHYPLYDLVAVKNGNEILVSVKCARAKRELRVGSPQMLRKMRDDCVVMAFLSVSKSKEIEFSPGGYEVLIIPGRVAREEGLAVHDHYIATRPGSADHSVMVKDKIDRNERTRSGAVFKSWHERFLNTWSTFDAVVQSRG